MSSKPKKYNPKIEESIVSEGVAGIYALPWESFIHAANQGVLASEVVQVASQSPFRISFFCEALDISSKSLDRYVKEQKRFNPHDSELILKWKILFSKGKDTFGSFESFGKWLQKPSFGLHFHLPQELLKTSRGVDLILEELERIDWGQIS